MRLLSTLGVVLLLLCAQHAFSQKKTPALNADQKIVPLGIPGATTNKYREKLNGIQQRTPADELARQRTLVAEKRKNTKAGARKPLPMQSLGRMSSDSTIHVAEDTTRFTTYKQSVHAKRWSAPSKP